MSQSNAESLLRVEWDDEGEKVELHGNSVAIRRFAERLLALAAHDGPEHLHLMSEEWGGTGLNGKPSYGAAVVHHLKIYKW